MVAPLDGWKKHIERCLRPICGNQRFQWTQFTILKNACKTALFLCALNSPFSLWLTNTNERNDVAFYKVDILSALHCDIVRLRDTDGQQAQFMMRKVMGCVCMTKDLSCGYILLTWFECFSLCKRYGFLFSLSCALYLVLCTSWKVFSFSFNVNIQNTRSCLTSKIQYLRVLRVKTIFRIQNRSSL